MTTSGQRANKPIKVVFLTFYIEAWDALSDVHREMLADSRFEVTVISTNRRFRKDKPFAKEASVSKFFDELGVEHIRFSNPDSFQDLEMLRAIEPDYVFINYPWQRNYPPALRVEELSKFTKICYVPYFSLALVNEPDVSGVAPYLYSQRSNQLASLIFDTDPHIIDAYQSTSRGNKHVHLTGSPKLDSLVRQVHLGEKRWPLNKADNIRLIWAPHHSYSNSWLNFGNFLEIRNQMLKFARKNAGVDIVMRPHPFMFDTLVSRNLMSKKRLDSWLKNWSKLPNTAIDVEGDIAQLFAAADLLFTDGISFLAEYPLATGKPAIFLEREGHWPFSPIGELSVATTIRLKAFKQFAKVFKTFATGGLPDRSREIATLRESAQPFPGQAAAKIIDVVVADYEAKTPLVDKSVITETPWESRPEAEPAWD